MVKVLSGREDVECLFGKDVSIISILGREGGIVFLGGDGKFSGQGGFLNVFVLKRDGLLHPVNMGVVIC